MSLLSYLGCRNVDIVIENHKTRKHSFRWPLVGLLAVAFFAIGLFIAWNLDADAAINTEINYQGKLTDINGVNVTDGKYDFRVRIYDAVTSGTAQTISGANTFIDINDVQVQNGIFNLKFSPLASGLTYGSGDRYLLVCFNTSSITLATPDDGYTGANDASGDCDVSGANDVHDKGFTPRKKLTSTPFARLSKYLGSSNVEGGDKTGVYVTNIAPQTGTGTISYANTTVTGVGTLFTQELKVGDAITSVDLTFGTNIRMVVAIASDTSLTVNQAAFQASATYTYQPSGYVMTTSNNLPYFAVNPDGVIIGASTTLPLTSTTSMFTGDSRLGIYNESKLISAQASNSGIRISSTLNGVNTTNTGIILVGSFGDTGTTIYGYNQSYTISTGANISTYNANSATLNLGGTGILGDYNGYRLTGTASGTSPTVTTYTGFNSSYTFSLGGVLAGDFTSYKGNYTFASSSVLNAGTDIKGVDITVTNQYASTISSNYGIAYTSGNSSTISGSYRGNDILLTNAGTVSTGYLGQNINLTNNSGATANAIGGANFIITNSGTVNSAGLTGNYLQITNSSGASLTGGLFGTNMDILNQSATTLALSYGVKINTGVQASGVTTTAYGVYSDTGVGSSCTSCAIATTYAGYFLADGTAINYGIRSEVTNRDITGSAYGGYFLNGATNTATNSTSKYGIYATSTGTFTGGGGGGTNNWGLYIDTVSGADNNYGAYIAGNTGIGTNIPSRRLDVVDSSNAYNGINVINADAGASARAALVSSNGTSYAAFGMMGTGAGAFGFIDSGNGTYINGKVGIGTSNSNMRYQLDVATAGGLLSQIRFGSTTTDAGGYLLSSSDSQASIIGGASHNGTNWIAKATSSSQLQMTGGAFQWYANTGLTPASSFTPTNVMSLSTASFLVQVPMDLNGTLQVNLENAVSTLALCHSVNGQGAVNTNLRDCTGAPVQDYMEFYSVEPGVGIGDVLEMSSTFITSTTGDIQPKLRKSTGNKSILFGIASNKDNAGDFNSIGYVIKDEDNPYPVALNGRVPVKIDPSTSPIKAGDYITASNTVAGRAVKATGESFVIAKAMEDYTGQDMIFVFITNTYYNPSASALASSTSSSWTDVSGTLTTNQDVKINGNLIVTKDFTVNGILTAYTATIRNLTVDKLNVSQNPLTGEATVGSENYVPMAIGINTFAVENTNVTEGSKIFLTLTSHNGKDLKIITKVAGVGFTVQFEAQNLDEVTFDYWIVGE